MAPGGAITDPIVAALDAADAALTELAEAEPWSKCDDQLKRVIDRIDNIKTRLAAVELAVVAQIDSRGLAAADGATSTAAWLRHRHRVHPGGAARTVRLATAVHQKANQVSAALAAGRVNPEQARVICAVLADLPTVHVDTRARAEEFLLDQAAVLDPVLLARAGRALIEALTTEPDADRRVLRQVAHRELHLVPGYDGMLLIRGQLDAESGASLTAAIDRLAAPRPTDPDGQPDLRTPARRRADALVDLTAIAVGAGDLPDTGTARPTLTVTIDHEVLAGRLAGAGYTDCGQVLGPESARRIGCDAGLIPVLLGTDGQVLDIGRASRIVPQPLRRALAVRDGGCAFPGCTRPVGWCDAHHIHHWADGGPTSLKNLCLLCAAHHTTVHDGGWKVAINSRGLPAFTPPAWIDPTRKARQNQRYLLRQLQPPGHDPPR